LETIFQKNPSGEEKQTKGAGSPQSHTTIRKKIPRSARNEGGKAAGEGKTEAPRRSAVKKKSLAFRTQKSINSEVVRGGQQRGSTTERKKKKIYLQKGRSRRRPIRRVKSLKAEG